MTTETYRRNCKDTARVEHTYERMEFLRVIDVWEESS